MLFRSEIMELLTTLAHEQKKAILMTTHDMDAGLRYADNLWLMHRQKPLLAGVPEDLVLQGKVGEYFRRPGLRFDREKGLFRADRKAHATRGTAFVKLENQEAGWLAKALERNNFVVEETDGIPEKGIFVCFESGSFRVYRDVKLMGEVQTIADVLEKLEA